MAKAEINSAYDNVNSFKRITEGMLNTYIQKNHDYGNSFDKSLDEFGLVAAVVRMNDKLNRLKSLYNREGYIKDESIRDTLLDLSNYAIMTALWLDNQKFDYINNEVIEDETN